MAKHRITKLEIRVDSTRVWLTGSDADGHRADVASVPKLTGQSATFSLDDLDGELDRQAPATADEPTADTAPADTVDTRSADEIAAAREKADADAGAVADTAPADTAPATDKSVNMNAKDAIKRLTAGETLDLTGEDRVTVLEAADNK